MGSHDSEREKKRMAGISTFQVGGSDDALRWNLEEWRLAVSSFFDVEAIEDQFEATISSFSLGKILIGQASASAQIFRRNEKVIQRSQIDHMMIQLYLTGGFRGKAEAGDVYVEEGDICCFDLSLCFETEATKFSNITMIVPKSVLKPLILGDSFHGLVIKSGEAANYLLGAHLRELLRICPSLDASETDAVASVTCELVRLCLRMPGRQRLAPFAQPGSLLERIRSFIGENLHDPRLDGAMICRTFGISRATLYRQFEKMGGVASVIRNWRLSNVFSELDGTSGEALHAIARRNGFSSEASCARAFKTRYGLSPSSLRSVRNRSGACYEDPSDSASQLTRWMKQLTI